MFPNVGDKDITFTHVIFQMRMYDLYVVMDNSEKSPNEKHSIKRKRLYYSQMSMS
jgi:hypothetical protein